MSITDIRDIIQEIIHLGEWRTNIKLNDEDRHSGYRRDDGQPILKPWIKKMPSKSRHKEALIFYDLLEKINQIISLSEHSEFAPKIANLFQQSRDLNVQLENALNKATRDLTDILIQNKHLAIFKKPIPEGMGGVMGSPVFVIVNCDGMSNDEFLSRKGKNEIMLPSHFSQLLNIKPEDLKLSSTKSQSQHLGEISSEDSIELTKRL